MKEINPQLKITDLFIYSDGLETIAEVHFVYMDQFHANGIFKKNHDSYSSIETHQLPSTIHSAITEEIEDDIKNIVDYLSERFKEEPAV